MTEPKIIVLCVAFVLAWLAGVVQGVIVSNEAGLAPIVPAISVFSLALVIYLVHVAVGVP